VNGEAADDVASDTWATVVKGLRRFTGDESAWRGWVFVTARRRAIDAGRRRVRAAQLEHDLTSLPLENQPIDPADLVAASHDTDAALRLLGQLSPLQAEVIALRVLTGLSTEEVAKIVHRSPGAVRVAAHRGLRRLEEILSAQGVTPVRSETL
jgi:RNA polymerase sigma-70 factor (ECF subfamily)